MKRFVYTALAGTAAIAVLASPADATVISITFTGTASVDYYDLDSYSDLGRNIGATVVYTIDDSSGTSANGSGLSSFTTENSGISAVVTLDGIGQYRVGDDVDRGNLTRFVDARHNYGNSGGDSISVSTSDNSYVVSDDGLTSHQYQANLQSGLSGPAGALYTDADFDFQKALDYFGNGNGSLGMSDQTFDLVTGNRVGFDQLIVSFTFDHVVVAGETNAPVDAVPEPATWAMMIGGFGLVGAAMRRRNRAVTALA